MGSNLVVIVDDEWLDYGLEEEILAKENLALKHFYPQSFSGALDDIGAEIVGVIARATVQISAADIKRMPNCKVISVTGGGFDGVDLEQATRQDIVVSYQGDYCIEEVSDHAMALLLCLEKNVVHYYQVVKEGKWLVPMPRETKRIKGSTLGLIGLGKISRLVAEKASGFGLKVVAFDPFIDADEMQRAGVRKVEMSELQAVSDYISIHVPLNAQTKGMINSDFLSKTKKGVILINTCRGGVINEPDLVKALESGQVAAAGLDVLGQEPPDEDNPLIHLPNAVITPHISYKSTESIQEVRTFSAQAVVKVLNGVEPQYIANRDVLR